MVQGKKKYVITFVLLALLCWLFPYTGDDWAWGSQIGIDRLNILFEGYSGRYLGNFIVLALTRSNVLKTLTMAATLTLLVAMIASIAKSKIAYAVACILFLLTPKLILRQSIVWTAGFSNYTTSVTLSLVFLIFAIKNPNINDGKKIPLSLGLFLLGVANALIVEHVTLYSVALSAALFALSIKDKKNVAQYASYCAGSVLGAFIMFSNSVYRNIASGQDGYRSLAGGNSLIARMKDNYLDSIYVEGFFNNTVLNTVFVVLSLLILYKLRYQKGSSLNKGMTASLTLFFIYYCYSLFVRLMFSTRDVPKTFDILNSVMAFIGIISLLTFLIMLSCIFNDARRVALLAASVMLVLAPLFVVTPIGSRCYFASYTFFVALIVVLIDYADINIDKADAINKALTLAACVLFVMHLLVFGTINVTNNKRLDNIRKDVAAGKTETIFTVLPFDSFLWTATPTEGIWAERYKLFYGLPDELMIEVKERK